MKRIKCYFEIRTVVTTKLLLARIISLQNLSFCIFNENSILQCKTTLHRIKKREHSGTQTIMCLTQSKVKFST